MGTQVKPRDDPCIIFSLQRRGSTIKLLTTQEKLINLDSL